MNRDNYSHILNIKIWCINSNKIIDNKVLNELVHDAFLKSKQISYYINLIWEKIEWDIINKQFDLGNIVIYSPFKSDNLLNNIVKKKISDLEKELYINKILLPSYRIIFKIVKPLNELYTIES